MNDTIRRWRETSREFQSRFDAIAAIDWDLPTPCEAWTLRQLVEHAVRTQSFLGSTLGLASNDGTWPAVSQAMALLLVDDTVLEGSVEIPGVGEMTKSAVLEICTNDLLIHTWDVARTIGGDERLPVALVAACFEWLRELPAPLLRDSGRYMAEIPVAADVELQVRMLAFAGRS